LKKQQKLSGWANFPVIEATVSAPVNHVAARQDVLENDRIIARGNGMSYGDAAIGRYVMSTLKLNQLLSFNATEGIIECEAGVLLSDLLPTIIPQGWFFEVTPGIKHITVGGAIASDVHGKNHPAKGCFSNWLISFQLMTADGEILTCSREQNTALFWQTCGGMGWTGVILSARFQLMRIRSTQMQQNTIRCQNLEAIFSTFEDLHQASYAAGWLDTTAAGANFGRGAVHLAEHLDNGALPLTWREKKARNIPLFAPSWLLNPLSIRAFNVLYFSKNRTEEKIVDMDDYFYPLDALKNWNRLYGHRGFVQYQFCLPEKMAFDGIRQLMEMVRKSPETPFLSVLKRHGERSAAAINTFPIKGYSLALDFPRTRTIVDLVKKLDELVWKFDGKIYLTKDACSAPKMGRVNPADFEATKFWSALRDRISKH
jgi:decaprenylphospho-beta-D-ribofuranose 2-oxidase